MAFSSRLYVNLIHIKNIWTKLFSRDGNVISTSCDRRIQFVLCDFRVTVPLKFRILFIRLFIIGIRFLRNSKIVDGLFALVFANFIRLARKKE